MRLGRWNARMGAGTDHMYCAPIHSPKDRKTGRPERGDAGRRLDGGREEAGGDQERAGERCARGGPPFTGGWLPLHS